jgi:hypothetical protein
MEASSPPTMASSAKAGRAERREMKAMEYFIVAVALLSWWEEMGERGDGRVWQALCCGLMRRG